LNKFFIDRLYRRIRQSISFNNIFLAHSHLSPDDNKDNNTLDVIVRQKKKITQTSSVKIHTIPSGTYTFIDICIYIFRYKSRDFTPIVRTNFTRRDTSVTFIATDPRDSLTWQQGDRRMQLYVKWLTSALIAQPRCISLRAEQKPMREAYLIAAHRLLSGNARPPA